MECKLYLLQVTPSGVKLIEVNDFFIWIEMSEMKFEICFDVRNKERVLNKDHETASEAKDLHQ